MKFRKIIHSSMLIVNCTLLMTLLLFSCGNSDNNTHKQESKETKEPEFLYGICIDSLDVKLDTIKKNQFLSNIMLKQNVDYNTITHIEKKHKNVFDIRKIKPGHKHTFLLKRDSLSTPLFWIYEIDKINYVVYIIATISLVLVSPSTEIILKLSSIFALKAACKAADSMAASVVIKESIVAILG